MVNVSQSAQLYQERRVPQDRLTRRGPGPRSNLAQNPVTSLPLQPPFPLPEVLQAEGDQPPDAGLTQVWPFGDKELP